MFSPLGRPKDISLLADIAKLYDSINESNDYIFVLDKLYDAIGISIFIVFRET